MWYGYTIKDLRQVLSQRIKPIYMIEELSLIEIIIILLCKTVHNPANHREDKGYM